MSRESTRSEALPRLQPRGLLPLLRARLGWALLAAFVGHLGVSPAAAQSVSLSTEERARCITSMVRVEVDTPGGTVSGSGTVIDPRGYVLTNFHVVGHRNHVSGTPGVLRAQRFRVALVRSERDIVVDEYEAVVVRGHVRLDLALLKIVRRVDGAPLESGAFAAMPIRADLPALSTPVWALGFPQGVRTIHVTAGQVAGFENDNAGEANWMRTDTEFNPGNSGGALIDATCHLLGVPTALSAAVEPIELARPTTRIPAAWLAALVGPDPLEVQPTEGLREIAVLSGILDRETGDDMGPNREIRYYRLPAARPGIATVSPRLVIATMGPGGRVIRESQGQVLVTASDSPTTLIAVVVPRGRDGRTPTVNLRYTPLQDRDAVAAVRSSGGGSVHGVVSRTNGGACATYVGLVAPGVDIRAATERMQRGEAPERELMGLFAALTTLESDGSFSLRASSGDAQLVVFGPQGIEHLAPIHVEEPAPSAEGTPAAGLDVGALQLSGGCRQ